MPYSRHKGLDDFELVTITGWIDKNACPKIQKTEQVRK